MNCNIRSNTARCGLHYYSCHVSCIPDTQSPLPHGPRSPHHAGYVTHGFSNLVVFDRHRLFQEAEQMPELDCSLWKSVAAHCLRYDPEPMKVDWDCHLIYCCSFYLRCSVLGIPHGYRRPPFFSAPIAPNLHRSDSVKDTLCALCPSFVSSDVTDVTYNPSHLCGMSDHHYHPASATNDP